MLGRHGVAASYRRSHGRDIEAACGQLAVAGRPGASPPAAPDARVRSLTVRRAGDRAAGTLGMASPETMEAWVIRPDRLGDPVQAMQLERIEVPEPGPGEVLVRVMAAGVNYNGVWASLGLPVSIFRYTGYDFHIAGSDASGIVERVGPGVTRWQPGDEVVIHCNQSCGECAECNGLDPMACTRQRIWAYETNWGSFAEYCKVQSQQLLRKPAKLTWEEAASYGLTYFTAYRMLVDRAAIRAGDNVLVWGAGGGLGTFAVQLCRLYGANAIAVVSSDDKVELVRGLGAAAVIDRREFALSDPDTGERNLDEIKRFGKAIRELTGGVDADVVFEHVGAATFFTSVFVCRTFGKIVICGATSGSSSTSTSATCGCARRRSWAAISRTPTSASGPTG